jgi:hypothetical protein
MTSMQTQFDQTSSVIFCQRSPVPDSMACYICSVIFCQGSPVPDSMACYICSVIFCQGSPVPDSMACYICSVIFCQGSPVPDSPMACYICSKLSGPYTDGRPWQQVSNSALKMTRAEIPRKNTSTSSSLEKLHILKCFSCCARKLSIILLYFERKKSFLKQRLSRMQYIYT